VVVLTHEREIEMEQLTGLKERRDQGAKTWIQQEHGRVAAPDDVVNPPSKDRVADRTRAMPSRVLGPYGDHGYLPAERRAA
jgi:hypothetical protein